ncbi:hypothetical protein CQW23_16493 [Capsicum baccatum]|uniref:Prolamin-like domain-containing protein n=1 Tax=Capsicum baccatum TaxID=33114 RepID=A0A2G2WB33_CAPBA|nr:hypothetical protein CQW23_16493 [Capsicum baccatum]
MSLIYFINLKLIFILCLLIAIKPSLGVVVQGSGPGFSSTAGAQGSGQGFSFGSGVQGARPFTFGSGIQGLGPGFSFGTNNGGPFFWSFNGPEADKCLATLRNTPGCIQEILGSLFKIPFHFNGPIGPPFHSIGPQCCKVVRDIEDDCWPKIFPISPLFPLTLKEHCSSQGQGQGQDQAPAEQQPSDSPPSPPQQDSNPLPSTPTSSPPPNQPFAYSFSFGNKGN